MHPAPCARRSPGPRLPHCPGAGGFVRTRMGPVRSGTRRVQGARASKPERRARPVVCGVAWAPASASGWTVSVFGRSVQARTPMSRRAPPASGSPETAHAPGSRGHQTRPSGSLTSGPFPGVWLSSPATQRPRGGPAPRWHLAPRLSHWAAPGARRPPAQMLWSPPRSPQLLPGPGQASPCDGHTSSTLPGPPVPPRVPPGVPPHVPLPHEPPPQPSGHRRPRGSGSVPRACRLHHGRASKDKGDAIALPATQPEAASSQTAEAGASTVPRGL